MKFHCPYCEQKIEGPDETAGQNVSCPVCGREFVVPAAVLSGAAAPTAPPIRPPLQPSRATVGRQTRKRSGGVFAKLAFLLLLSGLTAYSYQKYLRPEKDAETPPPAPENVVAASVTPDPTPETPPTMVAVNVPAVEAAPEPTPEAAPVESTPETPELAAPPARAEILVTANIDTVVFGDEVSEKGHGLKDAFTKVIAGGLGQSARKIFFDPADTDEAEGGYVDVTMKCDPLADNFVTLKLWGSDYALNSGGNLLIYVMENGEMHQVGFRDVQVGEFVPAAWGSVGSMPIPERFYYSTIPLPLSMTQGRTSVSLRVLGTGTGPKGSPGVYRAYVHQGSYFVPDPSDPQSPAPAPAPIRPPKPDTMAALVERQTAYANAQMKDWLAKGEGDPAAMARGFFDPDSPAYRKPAAANRAAEGFTKQIDETTRKYFKDPEEAGRAWGGRYGNEGMMIADLGAVNFGKRLDEVVDLGDPAGPAKRRVLYSKMLKASRDAGRFYRQGPTSAQSMLGDKEIYRANKGLQALGSPDALPEPKAMRYILEASGVEPWRGSDKLDGSSSFPMGTNYFEVTPAGLTKENGYVSAYGEVYDVVSGYYQMSRDPRLRPQLLKLLKARSYMRYPMVDADGYRVFQMVGPLDWRAHQTFPIDWAYGERKDRLSVAPATDDPMAVGFAKQLFADNQGTSDGTKQMVNWKDSGIRLPMTEGQPDFAWADVDNGLVAIKRGEELTWIETFWQARGGIHSTGRAMQITPTDAHVSHIRINTQFEWNGHWRSQADTVQWSGKPFESYLGTVHQAYYNERYMEGVPPDYAPGSRREEFAGRASFYTTRYGRYLVGINMDKKRAYVLKTPAGFTSAPDLVSKTVKTGVVSVGPFSAVVLDLGTNLETAPIPINPRFISANGIPNGIAIVWHTSGGASTYTLRRATKPEGPFAVIASGLGATYPKRWGFWPSASFIDTKALSGTTYYYSVTGSNGNGESYPSPVSPGATRGVPSINPLPAPWANIGFGNTSGSASVKTGIFTLEAGSSGQIGKGADQAHFVYRPLAGDGTLTVRLSALNGATQAGLMVRKTLAANAPFASLIYVPNGVRPFKRDKFDENIETMYGEANGLEIPVWLRLERSGLDYKSWYAKDENGAPGSWTMGSSFKIDDGMDGVTYIGMVTNQGSPTFDHIEATDFGASAPAAPAELTAVAGNGSVTLAWPPANGAATYTVKRSATSSGPFVPVVDNLASLNYTVPNLAPGTPMHFVVSAKNLTGRSADSPPLSATPLALPAPVDFQATVTGLQAALKWTAVPGATAYNVRRSVDGSSWKTVAPDVAEPAWTDSTLTAGQAYLFSVEAAAASGASLPTAPVMATAAPAAPHLRLADAIGTDAKLVWQAATGAASYNIWRCNTVNGTYKKVATRVPNPTFLDKNLLRGSETFYKISAVNPAGESNPSAPLKLGWGTGLLGKYFNRSDFSEPKFDRVDPFILFDWGQNSPGPDMNRDFSVRWTGQLEAPTTETYTFTGSADDSIQVFIDDQPLIGKPIDLVAGQKYNFKVEFRDGEGAAFFKLYWETPSILRQHLPTSRLFPAAR